MSSITTPRVHVSLASSDIAQSVAFYQHLFGITPEKHYPDYAKFAPATPSINLAINHVDQSANGDQRMLHMGIELPSTEDVKHLRARLEAAGLSGVAEESAACCYAISDKFWVTDPDGNQWEIFANTVTDSGVSGNGNLRAPEPAAEMTTGGACSPASGCCAPAPADAAATAPAQTPAFKPLAAQPAEPAPSSQGGCC